MEITIVHWGYIRSILGLYYQYYGSIIWWFPGNEGTTKNNYSLLGDSMSATIGMHSAIPANNW